MSAERYLDLLEACRLDLERIEAEQGQPHLTEGERTRVANLRALVTAIHEQPGYDQREIMWPSTATQVVQTRYLLPANLSE